MYQKLIKFYSRVRYERDGWADYIYLDFKKAIDKVLHRRLLWKLEHIGGLKRTLKNWMEDFFFSISLTVCASRLY